MSRNTSSLAHPWAQRNKDAPMAHAYALARELVQPVARGYLTHAEALAGLLAGTVRAEREGRLGPYRAADVFRLQKHLLGLHLEQLEQKRAIAAARIRHRLKPLLALRKPRNVLLAEAHDVNGAAGFPFDEPDVTDIATRQAYWAGRQHHA